MTSKHSLDQYYTKKDVAKKCVDYFENKFQKLINFDYIIEPSAGCGNILHFLPNYSIGLDLEPADNKILCQDYFQYKPNFDNDNVVVFGNPPFGKNSSTAIKFFNHSANFAKCIAFIVPRTFRKSSVIKRLNDNFHLFDEIILPLDSFYTPNGEIYCVPTVFQIWEKKENKRIKNKKDLQPTDWCWTDDKNKASHAIRRVGVKAGQIYTNPKNTSKPSHYYLISKNPNLEKNWKEIYHKYWDTEITLNPKWDVAGNPSLSKYELTYYYELNKITSEIENN